MMNGLHFTFRPFGKGLHTILGTLEAEVMEAVWASGLASGRDVHRRLNQRRPIAYTTVMTTLVRLTRKGFVVRQRGGGAHLYVPAISRDQLANVVADSVMDGLLEGFGKPAVTRVLDRLQHETSRRIASR